MNAWIVKNCIHDSFLFLPKVHIISCSSFSFRIDGVKPVFPFNSTEGDITI